MNKKKKNGTKESRKSADNKIKSKLRMIMYSVILLLMCISLLSRYAHLTKLQKDLTELNSKISELDKEKNILSVKLEEIKDSGWVEEEAKLRINMRKAKKDQIIYLDIKD